ncbi:MAG: mannose-6-phosphate isomerase, class I [Candidatus Cloacimonadales bacterium]
MRNIFKMSNEIQHYDWGSKDFIAQLKGEEISLEPQAEMWMGAHPKASSKIIWEDNVKSLAEQIAHHPTHFLGDLESSGFEKKLPFLLKILSAESALSIQAHPNKIQAEQGFARENRLGISQKALYRNYKDNNHKPELLCALTPFWAMCGFRSIGEIAKFWRYQKIWPQGSEQFLQKPQAKTFQKLFLEMLNLPQFKQRQIVESTLQNLQPGRDQAEQLICDWILKLNRKYPNDIGVLAPSYLNLIQLAPGEALYLKAGILHSYLQGSGIEIMANSDNVLRGGLTSKHIDIAQLQKTLLFDFGTVRKVKIRQEQQQKIYLTPAKEFELSWQKISAGEIENIVSSPEIILCTAGEIELAASATISLKQGESAFICAAAPSYRISGSGEIFRARVAAKEKS